MEKKDMVLLLSQGNETAWHELVVDLMPKVKVVMGRFGLPDDIKNDIAQGVFIDFAKGIDNFTNTNIEAFLAQKARWRSKDYLKRIQKVHEIPLRDDLNIAMSSNVDENDINIEQIQQSIKKLSRKERLVICLFYYNGCNYERIAEIMHKDYNWVKNVLHRTKKKLKCCPIV